MKWLLLVLLLPVVVAQTGNQGDTYIRVSTYPDFEYRADEDVVVPFQIRVVRGGVPQDERPEVVVRAGGVLMPLKGGATGDLGSVDTYPDVVRLNFGRLEPGLYALDLQAQSGGLRATHSFVFDVIRPPIPYDAALLGDGKAAWFVFEAKQGNFTVEAYRDGDGGRVVLDRYVGNVTKMRVPYIPGQQVKVEVTDPNGWRNYENRHTDILSGQTFYGPWIWNPDFEQTHNYRVRSWQNSLAVAGLSSLSLLAVGVMLWKRP